MKKTLVFAALITLNALPALAVDKKAPAMVDPAKLEAVLKDMYPKNPENWADSWGKHPAQDETQKVCSQYRNDPPQAEFDKIKAREAKTVKFPADGKVLGDWKAGQKFANNGRGGTFRDKPMANGGNCYACHQMDLKEVSYGTIGPSLHLYGKDRGFKPEEAKLAYAKIYNSMAVMPCSLMPRFGYHDFLSEQQMKDITAFLFDPESPVNK